MNKIEKALTQKTPLASFVNQCGELDAVAVEDYEPGGAELSLRLLVARQAISHSFKVCTALL
jgi:hypothetical protein